MVLIKKRNIPGPSPAHLPPFSSPIHQQPSSSPHPTPAIPVEAVVSVAVLVVWWLFFERRGGCCSSCCCDSDVLINK